MIKATVRSTNPSIKVHRNMEMCDEFNENTLRKTIKKEFRERWPEVAKQLNGQFEITWKWM